LQTLLPFRILGLDADNDSAFMNQTVFNFCKDNAIEFTLNRPDFSGDLRV
jgi:hypothetical protein